MNIRLTCSSYYLPERSPVWGVLAAIGDVSVGDYGDWPSVLTNEDNEATIVWVVFLEDILLAGLYA